MAVEVVKAGPGAWEVAYNQRNLPPPARRAAMAGSELKFTWPVM
jgi:hypothetical protein